MLRLSSNFLRKRKTSSSLTPRKKRKISSSNNVSGNRTQTTPMSTAATVSIARHLSQYYEVFLNFRGEDTRKTFTDHLYHRLVDARVCVFRDNEELHVGEEIHPNLLSAIQTSKVSIAIISPNYASGTWCLLELVQILKCRESIGQTVIPIFYHVDPSDVRHQTGHFGEGFSSQKKKQSNEVVQEWKEALEKVASLKVLELNNNADGYEGKSVKQVVEKVLTVLNKTTLVVPEYLVGVEEQAQEIVEMVDLQSSNDVQIVLIHGMGGIGKTTLAKALYKRVTSHFRFCSFLESVRERPMVQLQKQLISNILQQDWPQDIYHANEGIGIIEGKFKGMKVLLVLDDVDHEDQFNALVGKYDSLGLGSILIITTRNGDVLNRCHVKLTYELKELDFHQSFQLLCMHALQRGDSHFGEFETIARDIVFTTGGLPLAIEVIGCLLSGKSLNFWIETLKKLKRVPNERVQLKLKISYEALSYEQKQIFLDVSCLFPLMKDFESFMYMWDDCDYCPRVEIEILKSLSLIKVQFGQLTMHEQLRLLGREILRQESDHELGRCKILWNQKEALEVMETDQGTEQIEVLNLALDKGSEENCFTSEQFERLKKLRLLQLKNANLVGDFKNRFLSLRWLQWYGCPLNFMVTRFRPKNLVVLNLSCSTITEEWGGWNEMKFAEKLKVLKLCGCHRLKATPDFSSFKELEILDLSYCIGLSMIHPSICRLTKTLKTLNMKGCVELEVLPKEIGKMEELRELVLDETSIREVPIGEGFMTKLETLSADRCQNLTWLPDFIGTLTKLQCLSLIGCMSLTMIPESIGKLESLSELSLNYTNIKDLPESIENLHNLETLWICHTPMKWLPASIGLLKKLRHFFAQKIHGLTEFPKQIGELTCPTTLSIQGASISGLLNFPSGLRELSFSGCSTKSLPNLSYLTNLDSLSLHDMRAVRELPSTLWTLKQLSKLCLKNCSELMEIDGLEEAQSLRELAIIECRKISKVGGLGNSLMILRLINCNELKSLPDLSTLKNLRDFCLRSCDNIVEIHGLDTIDCLERLEICGCYSLERIGDFSRLTMLQYLEFGDCPKLRDIDYPCIDKFTSLEELRLVGGSPAQKFPDLSELRNLKSLEVSNFEELKEIPKLQELKSLESLSIDRCESLENLPDFSEFKNLEYFSVKGCEKLMEFRELETLRSNCEFYIFGCRALKTITKVEEDAEVGPLRTTILVIVAAVVHGWTTEMAVLLSRLLKR